ncbi:MAG: ATPase domain-containing protein [Candidatus Diapherotrites archaeon]
MASKKSKKKKTVSAASSIRIEDISYTPENRIEEEIGKGGAFSILVLFDGTKHEIVTKALVEHFIKDGKKGVYVSINKSPVVLEEHWKQTVWHYDSSSIFFVDCVSKNGGVKNSVKVAPQNLSDLDIAISESVHKKNAQFLIIDGLATLAIYNEEKSLKKFVKSLAEKISRHKIQGIVMATRSGTTQDLISDVSPFFDEVVDSEKL